MNNSTHALIAVLLSFAVALTAISRPRQKPDDELSPSEAKEVDQFVQRFNAALRRTRDLGPYLNAPTARDLLNLILLDKDDVTPPVDRKLVSQQNLPELRRFWIAISNLAYLSELYIYTRIPVNGVRTYELPHAQQYPPPVVRKLMRSRLMAKWWRDSDSTFVQNIAQLRRLTTTLEEAVLLMRARFRSYPPEQNSTFKTNIASFPEHVRVLNVRSCDTETDCAGLPLHTKTMYVRVPVVTLMLGWIDGKLQVLTVGMIDD